MLKLAVVLNYALFLASLERRVESGFLGASVFLNKQSKMIHSKTRSPQ
jgi:hypothetical protein